MPAPPPSSSTPLSVADRVKAVRFIRLCNGGEPATAAQIEALNQDPPPDWLTVLRCVSRVSSLLAIETTRQERHLFETNPVEFLRGASSSEQRSRVAVDLLDEYDVRMGAKSATVRDMVGEYFNLRRNNDDFEGEMLVSAGDGDWLVSECVFDFVGVSAGNTVRTVQFRARRPGETKWIYPRYVSSQALEKTRFSTCR